MNWNTFVKDYLPKFNNLQNETYVLDYDEMDIFKYQFCIKKFENNVSKTNCYNLDLPIDKTIDFVFDFKINTCNLEIRQKNKIPYDFIARYYRNKVYTNFQNFGFYIAVEDLDVIKEAYILDLLKKKDVIPTILMNNKKMLQVEISILNGQIYPLLTNNLQDVFINLYQIMLYYQQLYLLKEEEIKYIDNIIYITYDENFFNIIKQQSIRPYEDLKHPHVYFSNIDINYQYTRCIISLPIALKFDNNNELKWRELLDYVPLYQRDLFEIDNDGKFKLKNNNTNNIYCVDIAECVVLEFKNNDEIIDDILLIFDINQLSNQKDFEVINIENDELKFPINQENKVFKKNDLETRKTKYEKYIFQPLVINSLTLNKNKNFNEENDNLQIFKITDNYHEFIKMMQSSNDNIITDNSKVNFFEFNYNNNPNNTVNFNLFDKFYNHVKNVVFENTKQQEETLLNYDKQKYLLNDIIQIFNFMLFLKVYEYSGKNLLTNIKSTLIDFLEKEQTNLKQIITNVQTVVKSETNDLKKEFCNKIITETKNFDDKITIVKNNVNDFQ